MQPTPVPVPSVSPSSPNEFLAWVPLIAVFGALLSPTLAIIVTSILNTRTAKKVEQATKDVAKKLQESDSKTSQKLDTIHSLVNSRLTAALEKIDRLESRLFETEGRVPTGEDPPKPAYNPYPAYPGDGPALSDHGTTTLP